MFKKTINAAVPTAAACPQDVPQPGLDVWSEQRGAAVPWDVLAGRWGAAGGAQAPLWLLKGWVGWGAAGARAGKFTPGTGSCVAATADDGKKGREFPLPGEVGRGWVPAPACPREGGYLLLPALEEDGSQEGTGSPGAGGSRSTPQEGRKMQGKCQSERCTGSRVGGKALSGQPRLVLQGCL